jgi:hypothetical protein
MRQITCGETHKREVFDKSYVKKFLEKDKHSFYQFVSKSVLYENKVMIKSPALNYLNIQYDDDKSNSFKNMILKEYYECEKMYPYLGDYFLLDFFGYKVNKKGSIKRFNKKNQKSFLNTISNDNVKQFADWFFKNTNLNRRMIISYTNDQKNICVEYENDFAFKIDYDYDFINCLSDKTYRNYNYIIIDGYIETIGEIHHMLHEASNNKEAYVIFCYGMSEEVKQNIIVNNRKGITRLIPVSMNANDENTLNILNDVAAIHDGDVISSNLGQTISQEVRKKLKKGKKITFLKDVVYIDAVADQSKIEKHKIFLLNRLTDASAKIDVNIKPLEKRVSNFSAKRLNIYIPLSLKTNNEFQREFDYFIRFSKFLDKKFDLIDLGFKKRYMVPEIYKKIANNKSKSLQSMFNNIEVILS